MNELFSVDPFGGQFDAQGDLLIENIRNSLMIQAEMLRRIMETTPQPSFLLAELLEDAGNRYLDFSALVAIASNSHASLSSSPWDPNWPSARP